MYILCRRGVLTNCMLVVENCRLPVHQKRTLLPVVVNRIRQSINQSCISILPLGLLYYFYSYTLDDGAHKQTLPTDNSRINTVTTFFSRYELNDNVESSIVGFCRVWTSSLALFAVHRNIMK